MDSGIPLLKQESIEPNRNVRPPETVWSLTPQSSASRLGFVQGTSMTLCAENNYSGELDLFIKRAGEYSFVLHLASASLRSLALLCASCCTCCASLKVLLRLTHTNPLYGELAPLVLEKNFHLLNLQAFQFEVPHNQTYHLHVSLCATSSSVFFNPYKSYQVLATLNRQPPTMGSSASKQRQMMLAQERLMPSSPTQSRSHLPEEQEEGLDFSNFLAMYGSNKIKSEFSYLNAELPVQSSTTTSVTTEEDSPLLLHTTLAPRERVTSLDSTNNNKPSFPLPSMLPIKTQNGRLVEDLPLHNSDEDGPAPHLRDVILRGVNLSGNTKCPIGWATHESPFDKPVSFVGRPFPLHEADEHFARLQSWGFNCLRFLITWEAIEHQGPGKYDYEYLDYVEQCITIAAKYNLYVMIDPHQDVWSRFTGGSGAPQWTLELAGLDVSKFVPTCAAFTHFTEQDRLGKMTWPQNYQRFACLHMFTLMFSGKEFAPEWYVHPDWQPGFPASQVELPKSEGGVHITDLLQNSYFGSIKQLAQRLAKLPNVIGFDSFNEPSSGFVGKRLDKHPDTVIPPGMVFRPAEAMAVAAGVSIKIALASVVGTVSPFRKRSVNVQHDTVFLRPQADVWQNMGVWKKTSVYTYIVQQPLYFTHKMEGGEYNFFRDFLAPFASRYRAEIRQFNPKWMIFVEGDAFGHTDFYWGDNPEGLVNASHWYDGFTLFMRQYNANWTVDTDHGRPILGKRKVYEYHLSILQQRKSLPRDFNEQKLNVPMFLGEFGLPFDLNKKYMLESGDFGDAVDAMSLYYSLLDRLEISSAQWNYCTENSDQYGDMWNLENLSIFARGVGRGIQGFSRPYAPLVCGTRLLCDFVFHSTHSHSHGKTFTLRYLPNVENTLFPNPLCCTVVYVPKAHFASTARIKLRNARMIVEKQSDGNRTLYLWAATANSIDDEDHVMEPVELVISA